MIRQLGPGAKARRRSTRFSAFCLAVALASAIACGGAPSRPHEALADHAEPLRSQFNADIGTVRILMLVAPT